MKKEESLTSTALVRRNLTVCIVGGGSSAHILVAFLSEAGHIVNLLTRRPKDWHENVYCRIVDGDSNETKHTHVGHINAKSDNPSDVIPDAEVIILCMPVNQYRAALTKIASIVKRDTEVYIGTIYGQAGFNWMVHQHVKKEHDLGNVVTFAIGNIPWICRTITYGMCVNNFGGKDINVVAVSPRSHFRKLNDMFLKDLSLKPLGKGMFVLADSFLELTLSVDNQIIHPARCYGLWKRYNGKWKTQDEVPFFYKHFDQLSADFVFNVDTEYSLIRDALRKAFPEITFKYMLDYVSLEKLNHTSKHVDILASFVDSTQLAKIKTPVVQNDDGDFVLDSNFRFFKDDIPYGLLIAKSIAEMLKIETPFIDEVIEWAQNLRGESFIKDGKINRDCCMRQKLLCGIPEVYGFTKLEDIVY